MARPLILVTLLFLLGGALFAQVDAALEAADDAYDNDNFRSSISILEEVLSETESSAERAEVLWRLSRATLALGDRRRDAGAGEDELLPIFEEGEAYADRAIEADPGNHLGYFWKSANIGRWGQTKGILNSLVKAEPMRELLVEAIRREPEHAESYYVLGQLYEKVPGMISFGDADYAVSLARRSVALHEEQLEAGEAEERREGFEVKLAAALISRGWNERRRERNHDDKLQEFREAESELERGFYFEGSVDIPEVSDEEEAESILKRVIRDLEGRNSLSEQEARQLEEARELMDAL
jgi:tetratricopeptide (TPR) repeat protein